MKETNKMFGLLGVLGIWLTAGLALPFVNVLKDFTPEQLMVFRGFITAGLAFIFLGGSVWHNDKYTYLIMLVLPLATLGLFQGIRHWGAGPTIIILTATPLANIVFGFFTGRKISSALIIGLVLVLGGVTVALWSGTFQWSGFLWSLFAMATNAILYELLSRAKAKSLQRCFWSCIGMGTLGLLLSHNASWDGMENSKNILMLVGFAFVGGFLYWLSNFMAFENLPTNEASVLAQGETPAVIIGASLMLGEQLTLMQWAGASLAIYGACYLSRRIK